MKKAFTLDTSVFADPVDFRAILAPYLWLRRLARASGTSQEKKLYFNRSFKTFVKDLKNVLKC